MTSTQGTGLKQAEGIFYNILIFGSDDDLELKQFGTFKSQVKSSEAKFLSIYLFQ